MDPKYFSPNASADEVNVRNIMTQLVQSVKRNESEGVLFPREFDDKGNQLMEFKLLTTGGARQFDTDKIISRYNQQIAMSMLADFLMLGHENVGSQSLGVSKIELWMMAVEALAKSIAAIVNQHAIPRLLKLNGLSSEHPPELVFGRVESVDLIALGTFLLNATQAGLLIPDEGLEEHIRELADLPPINKEEREDMYGEDGYIYGEKPVDPALEAVQDQAALAAAQAKLDDPTGVKTAAAMAAATGPAQPVPGQPAPGQPMKAPAPAAGAKPGKKPPLPPAPKGKGLPKVPGVTPKKKGPGNAGGS
jgi:hypothetical protein